jgi:hypothetical protein
MCQGCPFRFRSVPVLPLTLLRSEVCVLTTFQHQAFPACRNGSGKFIAEQLRSMTRREPDLYSSTSLSSTGDKVGRASKVPHVVYRVILWHTRCLLTTVLIDNSRRVKGCTILILADITFVEISVSAVYRTSSSVHRIISLV